MRGFLGKSGCFSYFLHFVGILIHSLASRTNSFNVRNFLNLLEISNHLSLHISAEKCLKAIFSQSRYDRVVLNVSLSLHWTLFSILSSKFRMFFSDHWSWLWCDAIWDFFLGHWKTLSCSNTSIGAQTPWVSQLSRLIISRTPVVCVILCF